MMDKHKTEHAQKDFWYEIHCGDKKNPLAWGSTGIDNFLKRDGDPEFQSIYQYDTLSDAEEELNFILSDQQYKGREHDIRIVRVGTEFNETITTVR